MIGNAILDFVTVRVHSLINTLNGIWHSVDTSQFQAGWAWVKTFDEWVPISDMAIMLGIVATLVALSLALKVGLFLLARFVI